MTVKLEGLEEVLREMKRLEPRLQKNFLRQMMHKVAVEVRDDARSNAPTDKNNLRKNIVAVRRRQSRRGARSSVIVREEGDRKNKKNAFYWRFIEFGHFDRAGNFITGIPFLTRAFERIRPKLDSILAAEGRKRFEAEMRKRQVARDAP